MSLTELTRDLAPPEQPQEKIQKVVISASFTCEPLKDSLDFWMEEMGIPCSIEFSPYNQIFQQLLDTNSFQSRNEQGINIVLIRFEDWHKDEKILKQNVEEFREAVQAAVGRSKTPYIICVCPTSPSALEDINRVQMYQNIEARLMSEFHNSSSVYLVKSSELSATYPVADYYDYYGEQESHIPYKSALFCALGTMLARKIRTLKSLPHKVIVLDCDNTLWKGVCGEDGSIGVKISRPYQALQEFVVAQQKAGKLISLCSKNSVEDVFAVFDQHPDMVLSRHHLVNWRINWLPKSENLKSLASELGLGLDSFIFIDDNPVECAEVKANCPEVLTIQLPEDSDRIPQFLEHVWAFDQLKVTNVDEKRTELYQQNVEREHLRQDSLTFADFLAGLGLKIEIAQMGSEELPRVAQLTERTNQFNLTTIRRSESEIQQLCESGSLECQVVKVKDRFGDYGLVGLLLFASDDEALTVDTFLLSCRVLGRGVEHQMLAFLGAIAQKRGLSRVEVPILPTKKNQPALDFLENLGKEFQQEKDGGWLFRFPSEIAANFSLNPSQAETKSTQVNLHNKATSLAEVRLSAVIFERIANQLYSPELILQEISSRQQQQRPELATGFVAPRTPMEETIARMFVEVLKIDRVGIYDNFFNLGGNSLSATQLISRLRDTFLLTLSLYFLFEFPTIAALAQSFEVLQVTVDGSEDQYDEGIL
jgi:FkbH-like protein